MFQNKPAVAILTRIISILFFSLAFSTSYAAPINYGDFVGSSVLYSNVTETANTPGDTEPLFSAPNISGNQLDFNPKGFTASAGGGSVDITDGQLNFMLSSIQGSAITDFTIREGGDYTLFGTGSATTSLLYAISIGHISVLEVDGVSLASPMVLQGASASGGDNLGNGTDAGTPWSLGLTYSVNAALTNAGISFVGGATRLDIALDNILAAISQPSSIAMIAKKDFKIDVGTEVFAPIRTGFDPDLPITTISAVPVPAAAWLFASGLIGLIGISRRQALAA